MDDDHNQRQRRKPSRRRFIYLGALFTARVFYWLISLIFGGGFG